MIASGLPWTGMRSKRPTMCASVSRVTSQSENMNAKRRSWTQEIRGASCRRRYGAELSGLSSLPIASSSKRKRSEALNGTGVSTVTDAASSSPAAKRRRAAGDRFLQDDRLSFLLLRGSAADQHADRLLEIEQPEREMEIVDIYDLGEFAECRCILVVRVQRDDVGCSDTRRVWRKGTMSRHTISRNRLPRAQQNFLPAARRPRRRPVAARHGRECRC